MPESVASKPRAKKRNRLHVVRTQVTHVHGWTATSEHEEDSFIFRLGVFIDYGNERLALAANIEITEEDSEVAATAHGMLRGTTFESFANLDDEEIKSMVEKSLAADTLYGSVAAAIRQVSAIVEGDCSMVPQMRPVPEVEVMRITPNSDEESEASTQ